MSSNTENIKLTLRKLIANVPQDFALEEVRLHLKNALAKLESVDKKRERRENNAERREVAKNQDKVKLYDPFKTMKAIEEEITKEKNKLENIQRRRNQEKDDNNEFQTIFN